MSGHGHHDAGADPHAGHDDHHDETTSDDFPADEPRSPGWLPLLGGGLLLAAIFAFVLFGSDDKSSDVRPTESRARPPSHRPRPNRLRRPTPALRPGMALPPGHVPDPVRSRVKRSPFFARKHSPSAKFVCKYPHLLGP